MLSVAEDLRKGSDNCNYAAAADINAFRGGAVRNKLTALCSLRVHSPAKD